MTKSTLTTRKKSSPKPKTTESKIPPSQKLNEEDDPALGPNNKLPKTSPSTKTWEELAQERMDEAINKIAWQQLH